MSGHVQIYLDGELVKDYQGVLHLRSRESHHEVGDGESVLLSSVIEIKLGDCPC